MELLVELLANPFTLGLILGLTIAIAIAFTGWNARRELKRKIRDLEGHLHTKMQIDAKGSLALQTEVDELKKKNENLRISNHSLMSRPDKRELQTLHLYDKAIHLMYEKSPGFATAWEFILQEAQRELDETKTGLTAWVRKAIRPSLKSSNALPALDSSHDEDMKFIPEQKTPRR